MNLLERIHARHVLGRRAQVLSRQVAELLPRGARLLDVGCGDGLIAALVGRARPDVHVAGVDVLVRGQTWIDVQAFDGHRLPFADRSFDAVMFVDVLHHTQDPMELLAEAVRVARDVVVLKDHLCDGWGATPTLRLMDRVGNCRYDVSLPYNYWPRRRWQEAFATLGAEVEHWSQRLQLYPWPASLVFDRSLHFLARLGVAGHRRPASIAAN